MYTLEGLFPKNLYHSYIVEGDVESTPSLLRSYLQEKNIIDKNEVDLYYQTYDSFAMQDILFLKEWHNTLGISNGKKVCIIACKFINREVEQALLKIIEEPKPNSHIFFIVPRASILNPTILSRVQLVKIESIESSNVYPEVNEFLQLLPKERIAHIARIIESHKKNSSSTVLRFEALQLLTNIEKYLYVVLKNKNEKQTDYAKIQEIEKCRAYLDAPGASVKMLLEHIALVL